MITVVGSLNMDLVVTGDRIPRPGETVLGKSFRQIPGGKGGNQAAAAARLGAKVHMIGCIGKDSMGAILKASLKKDGVHVENIIEKGNFATGIASIVVDKEGNNSIAVAPGANYGLNEEDIEKFQNVISSSNLLLVQLESPLDVIRKSLEIAKSSGKITVLNPAPATQLDREILESIDILTPNETELELLSGMTINTLDDIKSAGEKLIHQGVKEIVVTLGSDGCMHVTNSGAKHYSAYKVKTIDTTAAGDSFNAGLAVYLSMKKSMDEAIRFAMKVGAMTVTKEGAQTSLPFIEEVKLFNQWIKEELRE